MKTKLISLLLSCMVFVSLAACTEGPGAASDETTGETTAAQTTEEITTLDDTTAEETTDVPSAVLAFNEDLLSDIGLTYSELVEKHGEKVNVTSRGGGLGYYFENGYGAYIWGFEQLDYGREIESGEAFPLPRDASGNIIDDENIALPKTDVECYDIISIPIENLFASATYPISLSDIQKLDGVINYQTGEDGFVTSLKYYSTFIYEGAKIFIYHNDPDTIDSDSRVDIRLS